MIPVLSIIQFKNMIKENETPSRCILRKQYPVALDKAPGADRTLGFTISTGKEDRDQDTLAVGGWDTGSYLKNPVVLWAHQYNMLPVGRAIDLKTTKSAMKSTAQFTPPDLNPCGCIVPPR